MPARNVVIVGAATVCLVAGCGSSSTSSAGSSAAKFSGSPIAFGITTAENTAEGNYPGVQYAADAAVKDINASGGVRTADGKTHMLQMDFCNNQATPAGSVHCATQLIDSHVVALVGNFDQDSDKADPLYTSAGVANFGDNPLTEWDLGGSDSYPIVGPPAFTYAGLGVELAQDGIKVIRPVGVSETSAAITPLINTMKVAVQSAGGTMLSTVLFPGTTTDYAPVVAQAEAGNPGAMVVIGSEQFITPFAVAAHQLGHSSMVTNVQGSVTEQAISSTGGVNTIFNGMLSDGLLPGSDNPEWAPYRADIAKYEPGTTSDTEGFIAQPLNAWLAVNAFKTVLTGMSGAVTSVTFKQALDHTTDLTTGGITPALNFTKPFACGPFSRSFNTTYYGPVKVENGKYVSLPGAALHDAASLVLNGFGAGCNLTMSQLGVK